MIGQTKTVSLSLPWSFSTARPCPPRGLVRQQRRSKTACHFGNEASGHDLQYASALAWAYAGDDERAQKLTDDLDRRFPEATGFILTASLLLTMLPAQGFPQAQDLVVGVSHIGVCPGLAGAPRLSFWVVFALFNGILIFRGPAFAGSILALTDIRVRSYS
jgi:hypothetical protein